MPNIALDLIIAKYNKIVTKQATKIATQKEKPFFKHRGSIIKKGKEGTTKKRVEYEWSIILPKSSVSFQSQRIPITEIKGSEAIRPPRPGYFLATSEIMPIITPDIRDLTIK